MRQAFMVLSQYTVPNPRVRRTLVPPETMARVRLGEDVECPYCGGTARWRLSIVHRAEHRQEPITSRLYPEEGEVWVWLVEHIAVGHGCPMAEVLEPA